MAVTDLLRQVTQTLLYNPDDPTVQGNCLQAAVASLLDLPLEAVPHFSQFLWWPQAMSMWARGRDLRMVGERTATIPERLSIVGGRSERGVDHVVIGGQGKVIWDPHPSRAGLVTIKDATWFEPSDNSSPKACWFCGTEYEWIDDSP